MSGKSHKGGPYAEVLNTIDLFSTPIHLTLRKKRVLSSLLGGLLTMILVIVICYQIGSQFISMFHHENPELYQITELEDPPSVLEFNPSTNFFLAILITVDSVITNITKGSPFNFPTNYVKYRRDEDGNLKKSKYPVLWAPCNKSDFPDAVYGNNTYTVVSLQLGYCAYGINYLDSSTGECPEDILKEYADCITPLSFDIQGTYSSENFDFLQSNLEICDPTSDNLPYGMSCTTDNMMTKFQTSQYEIDLYFANLALNAADYKTPNITFVEDVYWKLNPRVYKVSDIFVDKVIVQDSDDYVSTSKQNNRSYYMVNSAGMRELERFQSTIGENILQWNLRRSSKNLVVSRTYTKIEDVLTDLGGFSKASMFVAAFLAIGYVRYKYLIIVANELYDFEQKEESKDSKKKKKELVEQSRTVFSFEFNEASPFSIMDSPGTSIRRSEVKKASDLVDNKYIIEYFENQKRKGELDDSEWVYFKSMLKMVFCSADPQTNQMMKARRLATKDLDLIKTVKKLNEIDLLKFLILNKNQIHVLEFFENPLLTMNDQTVQHINPFPVPVLDCRNEKVKKLRASIASIASMAFLEKKIEEAKKKATPKEEIPQGPQGKLKSAIKGKLLQIKAMNAEAPTDLLDQPRKPEIPEEEFSSLSKYGKLYVAYRHLNDDPIPSNRILNKKLLGTLDPKLIKIFKRIDVILGYDYTKQQFEEVLKNILETPSGIYSMR